MGDVEHNEAGHEQDSLTDDDERTVLAEFAVGFVNHKADERVSDAVPQTHHHQEAGGNYHADTDEAQQVEGAVVHEHQVDVRCGVVHGKARNTPKGNAVNAVGFVVLVVILVGQGSDCSHSFFSFFFVFRPESVARMLYRGQSPMRLAAGGASNFMSLL